MTLIIEVAVAYVIGRVVVDLANTVMKVFIRRLVERSPKWQARIREDDAQERRLRSLLKEKEAS